MTIENAMIKMLAIMSLRARYFIETSQALVGTSSTMTIAPAPIVCNTFLSILA